MITILKSPVIPALSAMEVIDDAKVPLAAVDHPLRQGHITLSIMQTVVSLTSLL